MKKIISFVLSCLMLAAVTTASVSATIDKKPGEYTTEDVEELMNKHPRLPGEFSVMFADGVSEEEAKSILVQAGLPADLSDKTVYMGNGFEKKGNYVDVRVDESVIAGILLSLLNHEGVDAIELNWIEEKDLIGDLNGDDNVDAFDYMILKAAVLGKYELSDEQRAYADICYDGEINAFDYQMLKCIVLGL